MRHVVGASSIAPSSITCYIGWCQFIRSSWRQFGAWFLSALAGTMMAGQAQSDETSIMPNGIDHLVYASADLERGMDEIESLLGVRPVRGGRHPQYGTHNAQLSLGTGIYLEVIARDPDLPTPQRGAFIDIAPDSDSRLITWVYRTAEIQSLAAAAEKASIGLGRVETGLRTKPDGSNVSWHLTDPYAMPMGGAVPFLINWGTTSHPSTAIPSGGRLLELIIEHPAPNRVRSALSVLGAESTVVESNEFRLFAKIETQHGVVILN